MNENKPEYQTVFMVESAIGGEQIFGDTETYDTLDHALSVVKYGLETGDINDAYSIKKALSRDLTGDEVAQYQANNTKSDDVLAESSACTWTQYFDEGWNTRCGQIHSIIDGGPFDNTMHYCCYCGGDLLEEPTEASRHSNKSALIQSKQDYPIYSVVGLSVTTGDTELIINDEYYAVGDIFHTNDVEKALAKHEEFTLAFPKSMLTNNAVITREKTRYQIGVLTGALNQTSLPEEFCEAMDHYRKLLEANGGDDTDESREQFMIVISLAPNWFNDMAFNKAREMGLIPAAAFCTGDGKPVFKIEEIARHLGSSPEDVMRDIDKMQATQRKLGIDVAEPITDQEIHKIQ